MATTAYGLKTFKSDGTTVVLQPSNNSAVYGQTFTLTDSVADSSQVIVFVGDKEVNTTHTQNDSRLAGVVTTN
jgi:hypothetical protein